MWAAAAAAAPNPRQWLQVDIDATIAIDHSDRTQQAAPTWKNTFDHHGLFAFLARPAIAGVERLVGLLRRGNASCITAADHVTCCGGRWTRCRGAYRPDADDPGGARFWCAAIRRVHPHLRRRVPAGRGGFSFGYAVDTRVHAAVQILDESDGWYPAIDSGGGIRDGAWVAEATSLVNMNNSPAGTRWILRAFLSEAPRVFRRQI